MRCLLTFLHCFLILVAASAQQKLNAFKVVDSVTKKPVPAVSITIVRAKLAISTEKDGIFEIPGDLTKMRDTVIVSAQGYYPYRILIQSMNGMDSLKLIKYSASTVSLKLLQAKDLELNNFIKSNVVHYAGIHTETAMFDYLQLAQQFYLPKAGAYLKKINISRLAFRLNYQLEAQRDAVEMEPTKFRVRVYEADTIKGGPGAEISNETIEVEDKESQYLNINLSDYKIVIPGQSFFIAVEWMRDFTNQGYASVYQERSGYKQLLSYRPAIGISPIKGNRLNIWSLDIKHQWKPYTYFSPDYTDLAIRVIVQQ